jgi:hypothetical protein
MGFTPAFLFLVLLVHFTGIPNFALQLFSFGFQSLKAYPHGEKIFFF